MSRVRSGHRVSAKAPRDLGLVTAVAACAVALGAMLAAAPSRDLLPLMVGLTGLLLLGIAGWWRLDVRRATANVHQGLFGYLGTVAVGAGVLTVTFNGLRPFSGATVADLLFLGGGGFLVFHLLSTSSARPRVPFWLGGAAVAILAAGLLSALFAPTVVSRTLVSPIGAVSTLPVASDFGGNVVAAVRFSLTVVYVPLLIAMISDSRLRVLRIVDLWLASAVLNSLVALGDSLHLTAIGDQVSGLLLNTGARESGLTVHPNHLGTIAAMTIPVALSRATTAQGPLRRWLYWTSVVVIGAGVSISGSRAALLAGAVGIVLVLLLQRHERTRTIAGVAVLGAAAIIFISTISSESLGTLGVGFDRLTGGGGVDAALVETSNASRRSAYDTALGEIGEHPVVGTGFGGVLEAHDLYLQLLQGGGVLLLCAFACFAFGALRMGARLWRDPALSNEMQSVAGALLVSLLVWLIAGLVQNPVYDRYLYVPAGILLGLHLSARRASTSEHAMRWWPTGSGSRPGSPAPRLHGGPA